MRRARWSCDQHRMVYMPGSIAQSCLDIFHFEIRKFLVIGRRIEKNNFLLQSPLQFARLSAWRKNSAYSYQQLG